MKPAIVDERNRYRFYDEKSVERMQEILFYRELDFSLKSICSILLSPDYDKEIALKEQKELLILKKNRLERIIDALDNHQKGEELMKAYDNTEFEIARSKYAKEAKERWGKTDAYAEYENKTKVYSKEKYNELNHEMDSILEEFARCVQNVIKPSSVKTQGLVKKLQKHITENYYICTIEILAGLGKMYAADERFKKNIDKYADGTAEYIGEAIDIYVS